MTFDDGPGPYTRLVLAKLRKHGVRATFFIVGRNLPLIPGITRAERALGAVGDHTFTHPQLTALAPAQAEDEIVRTKTALEASSGGRVSLFRPPYGARDARIDQIARASGLLQILWTVDSADSLGANYARIEHNVISGLHGGSIVLMHENHGQTVRALIAIFAALQRKHLRAVSVPRAARRRPAAPRAGARGRARLWPRARRARRRVARTAGSLCSLTSATARGQPATRTASARRGSRTARRAPSPRTPPPRRRR